MNKHSSLLVGLFLLVHSAFCIQEYQEVVDYIHHKHEERRLMMMRVLQGNDTMAPTNGTGGGPVAGATAAPTNASWDGVVMMTNMTNATHGDGNIFMHDGNDNMMTTGAPMTGDVMQTVAPSSMAEGSSNVSSVTLGGGGGNGTTVAPSVAPGSNVTLMTTPSPTVMPTNSTPPPTLPATCEPGSDICGDKYFCSSASICEELTCGNWANNTPPYPAENSTINELPCVEAGAEPGTEFCGSDGKCYAYNCENWYKNGPLAYTGYKADDPKELTCEKYDTGYEDKQNSVVFGCRPYDPGNKAPEAKTWTFYFNRKCGSNPRDDDEFICYDNDPNTDYRDYQSEASRLNPPSCDREIYANEQPLYWYMIQMWQERKGETTKYKQGRPNTLSSTSFNANLAERTMFAWIKSKNDAPVEGEGSTDVKTDAGNALPYWSTLAGTIATILSLLFL